MNLVHSEAPTPAADTSADAGKRYTYAAVTAAAGDLQVSVRAAARDITPASLELRNIQDAVRSLEAIQKHLLGRVAVLRAELHAEERPSLATEWGRARKRWTENQAHVPTLTSGPSAA